jgi:hypothetical protein
MYSVGDGDQRGDGIRSAPPVPPKLYATADLSHVHLLNEDITKFLQEGVAPSTPGNKGVSFA